MPKVFRSDPSCEGAERYAVEVSAGPAICTYSAELCADDFHSNHDGWECAWPRTFALFETEDGPEAARFEVDREAVPQFTAKLIGK